VRQPRDPVLWFKETEWQQGGQSKQAASFGCPHLSESWPGSRTWEPPLFQVPGVCVLCLPARLSAQTSIFPATSPPMTLSYSQVPKPFSSSLFYDFSLIISSHSQSVIKFYQLPPEMSLSPIPSSPLHLFSN
jgi:hypothetical protein